MIRIGFYFIKISLISLEIMLYWGKFEGYREIIIEVFMKDDIVLNWIGYIENGKKWKDLKII